MPAINSLQDLLADQLNGLFSAEQQLIEALPKMAEASTGEGLKQGFLDHLKETKVHATRLENALAQLGIKGGRKTCKAMQGLVAEGVEVIALDSPGPIRDVALIGAARRVEHYEIAAYKATRALAGAVNEDSVADLLQQTLDEEADADKKLCTLSGPITEAANEGAPATANASGPRSKRSASAPVEKKNKPSPFQLGNHAAPRGPILVN